MLGTESGARLIKGEEANQMGRAPGEGEERFTAAFTVTSGVDPSGDIRSFDIHRARLRSDAAINSKSPLLLSRIFIDVKIFRPGRPSYRADVLPKNTQGCIFRDLKTAF